MSSLGEFLISITIPGIEYMTNKELSYDCFYHFILYYAKLISIHAHLALCIIDEILNDIVWPQTMLLVG